MRGRCWRSGRRCGRRRAAGHPAGWPSTTSGRAAMAAPPGSGACGPPAARRQATRYPGTTPPWAPRSRGSSPTRSRPQTIVDVPRAPAGWALDGCVPPAPREDVAAMGIADRRNPYRGKGILTANITRLQQSVGPTVYAVCHPNADLRKPCNTPAYCRDSQNRRRVRHSKISSTGFAATRGTGHEHRSGSRVGACRRASAARSRRGL
jgi:hypothetical protein